MEGQEACAVPRERGSERADHRTRGHSCARSRVRGDAPTLEGFLRLPASIEPRERGFYAAPPSPPPSPILLLLRARARERAPLLFFFGRPRERNAPVLPFFLALLHAGPSGILCLCRGARARASSLSFSFLSRHLFRSLLLSFRNRLAGLTLSPCFRPLLPVCESEFSLASLVSLPAFFCFYFPLSVFLSPSFAYFFPQQKVLAMLAQLLFFCSSRSRR